MEDPIPHAPSKLLDITPLTEILASTSSSSPPSSISAGLLSKPSSEAYLSYLTTLSLPSLLDEPANLQTESHHLTSSLTSLTHSSYPTFISLHKTTTSLTESLSSLSTSLDALVNSSLPALEECAKGWKNRTEPILRERSKARVVLEQHEKIRDLLDIPLLIDTCVRNGYFTEALSLASHATAIANKASKSSPPPLIISSVLAEVHNSILHMLLSLLQTLHEPNRKLPALWKAVSFLRKMDAFGPKSPIPSSSISSISSQLPDFPGEDIVDPEEQLALAFLIGRESCLKGSLEPCARDVMRVVNRDVDDHLDDREKEDLARYLKKYIDVWREGVHDVITQFDTIFLDRSEGAGAGAPLSPTHKTNGHASSPNGHSPDSGDVAVYASLHALIAAYSHHTLTVHILPILSKSLSYLSLSLLPSLLTQLTYCASAFSRVGLDFRGLLSGLFEDAVAGIVKREFDGASKKWTARVKKAHDTGFGANASTRERSMITELPSKWLLVPSAVSSPPTPPSPPPSSDSPPHIPPQLLASYPPIAQHTNTLLSILNNLRLLAPPRIVAQLDTSLSDDTLASGGEALLSYLKSAWLWTTDRRIGEEEDRERERRIIKATGQVYFGVFIPFMKRALVEGVFGVKDSEKGEGGELERVISEWEEWTKGLDG
ncbi:Dor1-like family-domain-containing protein [Cyathus striatus]|nr:Dor1-like family-domain-containing protein [Cyathus striatus]